MRDVSSSGHFSATANNKQQQRLTTSSFQYGGCLATLLNKAAHSAKESGQDPSGLGRWSYVRLRGKKFPDLGDCPEDKAKRYSKDLVVISAYRPNPPGSGESTVWDQQRIYFNSLNSKRRIDPRKRFTTDLSRAIEKWREQGCEVILGVDANEDLSTSTENSFRSKMELVGMSEAILSRHTGPSQSTYQRNSKNNPIDGIFVSPGVQVSAAGYYEFGEGPPSDHRPLWIDFDLSKALGGFKPRKRNFSPRKLVTSDHAAVRQYVKLVKSAYEEYDIPKRLSNLVIRLHHNKGVLQPKMQRLFNCLHRQMYDIRRKAELKCRKVSNGQVPWSPKLQVFWDRLALLKMLIKGRKGCRVSSRKIRRLMKKTKLTEVWKLSLSALRLRLKHETQSYKSHKKNDATEWRREHLEARLKAARRVKWKSEALKQRYLKLRRMKQREEARRRRRARGKGSNGGLKAIQIEEKQADGTKQLRTVEDQAKVEAGCRQENSARYDQTRFPYCTPPMSPPLYGAFTGPNRKDEFFSLLEGRRDTDAGIDEATDRFLAQCRFISTYCPEIMVVTPQDHYDFWSKMKEDRGSEPHGLHNGHFKAALVSPLLYHCDAVIRNIPLTTGFVPDNWKNLMNFAIEKKPGDFRLSKMRTIQLMNSEFQANNKKMGKASMAYGEKMKLIPAGQCGARKQHQAIDLALSKRLVWDLLFMQRRAAGWISNDAKSCFDRIVHWVAIVALLRFGITWYAVSSAFDTLAQSSHRVRTGFGDSEEVFSPPSSVSFQGCGQGNGAGPAIWVAVSSILITMMESSGYGFECLSAIEQKLVVAQCFAFIDDTDVIEAAKSVDQSFGDIAPRVQAAASLWSGGIRATGGSINPEKSFCWYLDYSFDQRSGTWSTDSCDDIAPDLELQIQGLKGTNEVLPRLEPTHSERTLGVMLAPVEDQQAHVEHLSKIATDWAAAFRPSHLLRHDVFPVIKTTIMKSLEYPMALTTLDQETWRTIVSKVVSVTLPKAGVCRTFPQSYVFAPVSLQGLGLPHPFALQVIAHLDMLLRHPANRTQTFTYLEAVIQAHQLETGTSYGIFQQDYSNTAILASNTWIKRVWEILERLGIYIAFDSTALALHRQGDQLLNDLFIDLEVDQDVLLWLNWCSSFLQARTVSDIVTADGGHIRESAWLGIRDSPAQTPYQWARTVRPSAPRHWSTWQQCLSEALLTGTSPSHPLTNPLGEWFDDLERWDWLLSPSEGLFQRVGHVWRCHRQRSSTTRATRFFKTHSGWWTSPLPSDVSRASVHSHHQEFLVLEGIGDQDVSVLPIESAEPPAATILDAWQRLDAQCSDFHGWVPDEIEIQGDEWELFGALMDNRLRIISDGSYDENVGTAAIQLIAVGVKSRIIVRCQVPGLPDDQSPYRSELLGILAGIMVADWLLTEWAPKSSFNPKVTLACDGLSALNKCFGTDTLSPFVPQFDVISSVRSMLHKSSLSFTPLHVKGHQDLKSQAPLTWWELRNLEVDDWAVQFRHSLPTFLALDPPNPRFFLEPAAMFIDGVKQSSVNKERIHELVARPKIQERWHDYDTLSPSAIDEVDWKTLRRGMNALPQYLQRWTSKHSVGICGVGRWMKDWNFEPSNECPLCGSFEDHLHVPRCLDSRANDEWKHQVSSLSTWMLIQKTSPAIQQALLHLLSGIRQALPPFGTPSRRIQTAVASQLLIGCQGLLEGRISKCWVPLQKAHYRSIGSQRSAHLWASRLTKQLILVGYNMWLYRNSIKHSDESVQCRALNRQVDAGILSEFAMGTEGLSREIKPKLKGTVHRVLRKPLQEKQVWLQLVSSDRKRHRRALAAQVQCMHSFLHSSVSRP